MKKIYTNKERIVLIDEKTEAFTLAEVLLTLGIIGVVSSMTIPALVSNYQNKVLETQTKKSTSVLSNGYKMALAKEEV